jgi:signal transduction histidine kinase
MGELLKSAIFNLIDNAIDYSPAGETVDVFVSHTEGRFLINVKDNGPGIPDEFLPKLFLRFSRNEPNKRKGSGIGLSITKKIVELHNGEIRLLEHRKGTIFQIRL